MSGTVCCPFSDNLDRTIIQTVQAVSHDTLIWIVRPRRSVNSF